MRQDTRWRTLRRTIGRRERERGWMGWLGTSPVSAPTRRDNLSCMKCRLAVLARDCSVPPSFLPYLSTLVSLSLSCYFLLARYSSSASSLSRSNREALSTLAAPFKFRREFPRIKGMPFAKSSQVKLNGCVRNWLRSTRDGRMLWKREREGGRIFERYGASVI